MFLSSGTISRRVSFYLYLDQLPVEGMTSLNALFHNSNKSFDLVILDFLKILGGKIYSIAI
jgi:hypothetical protein